MKDNFEVGFAPLAIFFNIPNQITRQIVKKAEFCQIFYWRGEQKELMIEYIDKSSQKINVWKR